METGTEGEEESLYWEEESLYLGNGTEGEEESLYVGSGTEAHSPAHLSGMG